MWAQNIPQTVFPFTALSLKPNDALVYGLRAEVRGKIGAIEEAMADYNQALDLQEYAQWSGYMDCGFCSGLHSCSPRNWNVSIV